MVALPSGPQGLQWREWHDVLGLRRHGGVDGDEGVGLQPGDREVLRAPWIESLCRSRAILQAARCDTRSPSRRIFTAVGRSCCWSATSSVRSPRFTASRSRESAWERIAFGATIWCSGLTGTSSATRRRSVTASMT